MKIASAVLEICGRETARGPASFGEDFFMKKMRSQHVGAKQSCVNFTSELTAEAVRNMNIPFNQ